MSTPTQPWKPKSRKDFFLKGPGLLITMAAAGVVIAVLALIGNALGHGGGSVAKDIVVSVTKCDLGETTGTVGLEVTNNGSTARTVRIGLEYRDGSGRRIDTDTALVRDVQPGDKVVHDEPTFLNAAATGVGTCSVTSVS